MRGSYQVTTRKTTEIIDALGLSTANADLIFIDTLQSYIEHEFYINHPYLYLNCIF